MIRRRPFRRRTYFRTGGWRNYFKNLFEGKRLFRAALLIAIWGFILGGIVLAWFAYEIPDVLQKADLKRYPAIIMEARDGTVFARTGHYHGDTLSVKDVPPHLIHAFLAVEDRRFYEHSGVDVWGVMRAAVINLMSGRVAQGGSTITQQLAKNLFLGPQRTLRRKIQEVLLAIWLENKLTKDEILSAYLNRIYLGSGAYGVDAAAQLYFGKSARNVSVREAAILAGLPRAPSRYSPFNNPQAAEGRSRTVLQAMVDAGYLDEGQIGATVTLTPLPQRKPASGGAEARYFVDFVMDQLGSLIEEQDQDVIIRTSLDLDLQRTAETGAERILSKSGAEKQVSQVALFSIGNDGAVRALVGGADYITSPFNRATQAKRQPGSAFKPFVFLAALEGGMDENTLLLDAPLRIGGYSPENFERDYRGEVTLQDALAFSLNTATVRLAQRIGIGNVKRVAQRLGITSPLKHELGLALGISEVSLEELTSAYAVIANGGHAVLPYGIESIRTKDNKILYRRSAPPMPRLLDGSTVAGIDKMLQACVEYGTGRRARLGRGAAGKTGTTQDHRDAWFVGYSANLTTGVWMGNDDNKPTLKVVGGTLPAQLWHDAMIGAGNAGEPDEGTAYTPEENSGFMRMLNDLFD